MINSPGLTCVHEADELWPIGLNPAKIQPIGETWLAIILNNGAENVGWGEP